MNLSIFAERLSELIFEAKLTPSSFAKELGCGRATINRYLNERKMPALDMVIRMADFFQCTTDFLLGLENDNYAHTFHVAPPFHERFTFLCEKHKMKKSVLQRKTNVPESAIYYWLRGTRRPTIENVVKLAEAFECSVDYILGRSDL